MRVPIVIIGLGSIVLSGCSDSKKANEVNFQTAINAHLAKSPSCIDLPTSSVQPAGANRGYMALPLYYEVPQRPGAAQDLFRRQTRQVNALVAVGLMEVKDSTIPQRGMFAEDSRTIKVKAYDLTDKGRQALAKPGEGSQSTFLSSRNRLCYGTPDVVEITQFTEPADAMGVSLSRVAYTYRLKDKAAWATNPTMLEAFPVLKRTTGDKVEDKADLVLTNKGWVHARDAKL
ncbi:MULTISPECIES: hypothetical protein [unclassified Aureimonas]|uniref:hypothetical protein n=1 Tax=unclassified Aureimonas TaxID=2615206 RepID=UPI0012E3B623|nr:MULTISPECIES: hypothetical protein [unclassified Aureimonas]